MASNPGVSATPYTMRMSWKMVDKLGVKLYDRVSNVLAELVSNSYDADAEKVTVTMPMDTLLATKSGSKITDLGLKIVVEDDGHGMTPQDVNDFYLVIGSERRADKRGEITDKFKRKVQGRKGIGKLAPFGICNSIEVWTAGPPEITENGSVGYRIAHFFLLRDQMELFNHQEGNYTPTPGPEDQKLAAAKGTRITLSGFSNRRVSAMNEVEKQLAQRFGISSPNWCLRLVDSNKTPGSVDAERIVGKFMVDTSPGTRITCNPLVETTTTLTGVHVPGQYGTVDGDDGTPVTGIEPGFVHEGKFFPIRGWMAYSKAPYKDSLMSGVRIYCRAKLASQTSIFNLKAGFTGEHDVRSYLVGELHADWLDQEEDLILTDRRDILWSHEPASLFEAWGQMAVKHIGKRSREPMKVKAWDQFQKTFPFKTWIEAQYPLDEHKDIREKATKIVQAIAKSSRIDELEQVDYCSGIARQASLLAPVLELDDSLNAALDTQESVVSAMAEILQHARLAEVAGFGAIAENRVKVVLRLEEIMKDPKATEDELQELLEEAPWLINPEWHPLTMNQSFKTLIQALESHFEKNNKGATMTLAPFRHGTKRPDFVATHHDGILQIVEIKSAKHIFDKTDFERLHNYYDNFEDFFANPAHAGFLSSFRGYKITLVAKATDLSGMQETAFKKLVDDKKLELFSWDVFLKRARTSHEDFIRVADEQKRMASATKTTP